MKIGIIVAMEKEIALMRQMAPFQEEKKSDLVFWRGKVGAHEVMLTQSGIGKVCAARTTTELIGTFHPDIVINSGVAGGLDKSVSVMDIVIGTQMAYHDVWCGEGTIGQVQGFPLYFESDSKLSACVPVTQGVHKGLICSGDQFISEQSALKKIKKNFPEALAVDMESAAVAQVCFMYRMPFLSLRIISDTPGIENHLNQYDNFWELSPQKTVCLLKQTILML